MVQPVVFHGRDEKQPIIPKVLSRILTIFCTLSLLIDITNRWLVQEMAPVSFPNAGSYSETKRRSEFL